MICRKSMDECKTPGMCAPFGGCQDSAQSELAALREELYQAKEARDREMLAGVRLQRDLVAIEQQNEKLVALLKEMRSNQHTFISFYRGALDAALKPTESGASE